MVVKVPLGLASGPVVGSGDYLVACYDKNPCVESFHHRLGVRFRSVEDAATLGVALSWRFDLVTVQDTASGVYLFCGGDSSKAVQYV